MSILSTKVKFFLCNCIAVKKTKMVKKGNELQVLRWVVGLAIIVYIVGVAPTYNKSVNDLFHQPIIKLIFLVLVVFVASMDHVLGLLLAVAFLVSLWSKPSSGGVLGDTVREVRGDVQSLLDVHQAPMHELPKHNGELVRAHEATKPVKENMSEQNNVMGGAQGAFEAQQMAGEQYYGQGSDCTMVSPPSEGCDTIVGYNAPYDCVCDENCTKDCAKKGRGCLCTGVATWQDELNAQGMNYPMGNGGPQVGATF